MKNNLRQPANYLSDILGKPLSRVKADWQSISLEENHIPAGKQPEMCINKHVVGINLSQHVNIDMKLDGRFHKFSFLTGNLILLPAGIPIIASLDKSHNSLSFNLTEELLLRNSLEMWDEDKVDLVPSFPVRDPLINQIVEAIHTELITAPDGCKIYATSMANSLAGSSFK